MDAWNPEFWQGHPAKSWDSQAEAEVREGRSRGCSRECLAPALPSLASTPWPEE